MTTSRWEQLAREDAEFYIWTDVAHGDDFFASGERDAERIRTVAAPYLRGNGLAVEIGCGIGRLTIPMSSHFARIVAVDIAPTMIAKLAANCASRSISNVTGMLNTDRWEESGTADFAYSRIVYQHIESWPAITDYFRRISSCLAPEGIVYAQFDTRPPTVAYHVKNAMPDVVLPRNYRRGVRRIRRTVEQIVAMAAGVGLSVVHQRGNGTEDTELILARAAVSPV